MNEAIVVAIITGLFALLGTYMTVKSSNEAIMAELKTQEAVQDERILSLKNEMEQLRLEVRKHNDFAVRLPVLEEKIRHINKE